MNVAAKSLTFLGMLLCLHGALQQSAAADQTIMDPSMVITRWEIGSLSIDDAALGNSALLHRAVSGGLIHDAEVLIGQGADVNAFDATGRTPLHLAASRDLVHISEMLIERGADVNAFDTADWTPLHVALASWHGETPGSDIKQYWSGSKRLVELLVRRGADVNAASGCRPIAGRDCTTTVFAVGDNAGRKYWWRGWTPLRIAAALHGAEMVSLLLESDVHAGASCDAAVTKGEENRSPKVGESFRDCPECPELVVVPAGTFMMGSHIGSPYEQPLRSVSLPSFAVGVHEVTFAQWDACVANGGCGGYRPDDEGRGRGKRPVANVDWGDAQLYLGWLSHCTGERYRLPTEAEWEYAARAGSRAEWHWGDDGEQCSYANGADAAASCDDGHVHTAPVGSYIANAWGLHDVLGNVQEWVQGCPAESWSRFRGCGSRILRGGGMSSAPFSLRSASRPGGDSPRFFRVRDNRTQGTYHRYGAHNVSTGFRVARTLEP